ncbi:MAG: nicotinate (nicotinamide) nucleotide adenylyltransferase [Saccharofermentanales bacterium]|jgi:nicotinate-nucleotide adenylyltransferase
MIGLFGGTFDPFHAAHRTLIECAMDQLPLDRLVVMPVGRPPHKQRRTSFAAFRHEMALLGTRGLPGVEVSDEEIRTPGVDYSLTTVRRLKATEAVDELWMIAGSDVLCTIESWHRYEELLSEVVLAIARRGDDDMDALYDEANAIEERYGARVTFFEMPPSELSGTDIRHARRPGDCPPDVEAFLDQYKPYTFADDFRSVTDDQWQRLLDVEEAAWPFMSQYRRVHSASVAQYAARLANIYAVDVVQTATAALLHDVAKDMPIADQQKLAEQWIAHVPATHPWRSLAEDDRLLHALASAELARRHLSIEVNDAIAEAIALHTTAAPGMGTMAQIVYLADKIAFDRTFRRLGPIRAYAEGGMLAQAMVQCLEEVFEALRREAVPPHRISVDAHDHFRARLT